MVRSSTVRSKFSKFSSAHFLQEDAHERSVPKLLAFLAGPGVDTGASAGAVILSRMRPAGLRKYCLSFPGSVETFPFGPETSVFKVEGKMFALSQLARPSLRVSLKCEPELAEQLRGAHPAVLPGYHLNKRHWNTVIIDGSLPEQMIKDMIEDSYDLVS
jgi:predicted DNA-binding protein (MmcQ/YjbR family)